MSKWKVSERCSVRMRSGVIVPNAVIVSLQHSSKTCKVYWEGTDTYLFFGLKQLIKQSAQSQAL